MFMGSFLKGEDNRKKLSYWRRPTPAKRKNCEIAAGPPVRVLSLRDFPGLAMPPETGRTFKENALIKAKAVAAAAADYRSRRRFRAGGGLPLRPAGGLFGPFWPARIKITPKQPPSFLSCWRELPASERSRPFPLRHCHCHAGGRGIFYAKASARALYKSN